MTANIYRFTATVVCLLANGDRHTLENYEIVIETHSVEAAKLHLNDIALQQIVDAGSELLDAPVEEIEIVPSSIRAVTV